MHLALDALDGASEEKHDAHDVLVLADDLGHDHARKAVHPLLLVLRQANELLEDEYALRPRVGEKERLEEE